VLAGLKTSGRVQRRVAVAVGGAIGVVTLVGCQNVNVAPQQATKFRPELLGRLFIGMPEADIMEVMGAPLHRTRVGQGRRARDMLTYAETGAWLKGDVSINSTGHECLLWLHEGQLDEAFFFNTVPWEYCWCKDSACPPDWAAPCQISSSS